MELDEKLDLPPGRVKITVQVASPEPAGEDSWTVLESIWAQRKALGMRGRTKEEIDTDVNALREEWNEQQQALERTHDEARREIRKG